VDRTRLPGLFAILGVALLALAGAGLIGLAPPARGAVPPADRPLTGAIVGPKIVGTALNATFAINASGGPAQAANGTVVGTYSYNATLAGPNTTSASVAPPSGILVNQRTNLSFTAPNVTQTIVLTLELTSSYKGSKNVTNLTYSIAIVVPYTLHATVQVGPMAITSFNLTVLLDGSPVGTVAVPTLQPNATFPVVFHYVSTRLSEGYHTFDLSLAEEHGLVTFAGGSQTFSERFYVAGPAPNYAIIVAVGVAAFVAAVFIWGIVVGGRRRGRRAR
jgi:hypothetical protein